MAGVMAKKLRAAADDMVVIPGLFPKGVLSEATDLLGSARQRFEQPRPQDILRTAADYSIVMDAINASLGTPFSLESGNTILSRCAAFADSLERHRKLLPYEGELAKTLAGIFAAIEERGQTEVYDVVMSGNDGHVE
jgi:hypothetical protein